MSAQSDLSGGIFVFAQRAGVGGVGGNGMPLQSPAGADTGAAGAVGAGAPLSRSGGDNAAGEGEFARLLGDFTAAADGQTEAEAGAAAAARGAGARSGVAALVTDEGARGALDQLLRALSALRGTLEDIEGNAGTDGAGLSQDASLQQVLDQLRAALEALAAQVQALLSREGLSREGEVRDGADAAAASLSATATAQVSAFKAALLRLQEQIADVERGLSGLSVADGAGAQGSAASLLAESLRQMSSALDRAMPGAGAPRAAAEGALFQSDPANGRAVRGEWSEAASAVRGRGADAALAATAVEENPLAPPAAESARSNAALNSLLQAQSGALQAASGQTTASGGSPTAPAPGTTGAETTLRMAQPAQWPSAIGARIAWMLEGGQERAELRLDPPRLGQISVRINSEGEQLTVNFVSAVPQVREALEAALPRLREMMGEQGLAGLAINIESGASGEGEGSSDAQRMAGAAAGDGDGESVAEAADADADASGRGALRSGNRLFEGYA